MSTATTKQTLNERRIRGSKLAIMITCGIHRKPFEEGLALADSKDMVIASNKRIGQALVGSEEWEAVREALPCWSGTMTAYVEPAKKLGKTVEYVDPGTKRRWVFPVPDEHQDKKDAILIAEHPDYFLETDGKNLIVRAAHVDLIEKFPAADGWFPVDPKHDTPIDVEVENGGHSARRFLQRIRERVGPVSRSYIFAKGDCFYPQYYDGRRYIVFGGYPYLGIIVEAP